MITQGPIRRTLLRPVAVVLSVVGLALLSACGGGSSAAPKSLSLSGDKVPVSLVQSGLTSLCTVAHQANNPQVASATYFATPYNNLHQLAAALSGSRRTALLTAMETFERAALASSAPTTVSAANSLLGTVDSDLKSMKLSPVKCSG
jgi:hypothetical protein